MFFPKEINEKRLNVSGNLNAANRPASHKESNKPTTATKNVTKSNTFKTASGVRRRKKNDVLCGRKTKLLMYAINFVKFHAEF